MNTPNRFDIPQGWDYRKYLLYNEGARRAGAFTELAAQDYYRRHGGPCRFEDNDGLHNKNHIVTLLGYSKVEASGNRHTNWFPWNRFRDVFETLGYACEWLELDEVERGDEKRIFITWNEPTVMELYEAGAVRDGDIVFQKLTSLGKGMEKIDWTADPRAWSREWEWPIYRTVEYLVDLGLNVYAFGCATDPTLAPEKQRIVDRLGERLFWISWGGTPFDWAQVLDAAPKMDGFLYDIAFVGSKWGRVGRGNIDAWDRYLTPLENSAEVKFEKFGGIGAKMVSDEEMVKILRQSRLCPIIHAPSWQAERGVQDRFYTVFLSGRFGVCDNLGAVDLFGDAIADIVTEDPAAYYDTSLHFAKNVGEQLPYIEFMQKRIKEEKNFYVTWRDILSALPETTPETPRHV